MKKILISLGIFIFSLTTLGVADNEAIIDISAEFLAPITIETTEASFGTIVAETGIEPTTNSGRGNAKNGTLSITGNGKVFISWKDKNSGKDFELSQDDLEVILKKDGDTSGNPPKLISKFKVSDNAKLHIFSILATKNKQTLQIIGTLTDVNDKTASGTYSGAITFRITYDEPTN